MNDLVKEYIAGFPKEIQLRLLTIRETILAIHPEIKEGFSYQMPAYSFKKPLVYFAGYKNHIGFYPTGSGIKHVENMLKTNGFAFSKGSIQFRHDEQIPIELIRNLVHFKLNEQL